MAARKRRRSSPPRRWRRYNPTGRSRGQLMPSPFPGMDPYLEGVDWPSIHAQLSVVIAQQLGPKLRPRYYVRAEKSYILTSPDATPWATMLAKKRPDVSVMAETGGLGVSGKALIEA